MRRATCLFSLRSSLAAAGVSSILQAKALHQRCQRDGGFIRTAVGLLGGSAQVRVLKYGGGQTPSYVVN